LPCGNQIYVRLPYQSGTVALAGAVIVGVTLVVLAAALSATEARDPMSVVRFMARYLLGLALLLALGRFLSDRVRLARLETALVAGAVASVALAGLGFFVPQLGDLTVRYGDRAQALLNHPNQFAMLLTAMAPIALARALERPRRSWGWVAFVLVAAGVGLTGSKANLLLLVVVVPTFAILAAQLLPGARRRLGAAFAMSVGALAVGGVAFAIVRAFNPRTLATLERLFLDPANTTTVSLRREMWGTAIQRAVEQPWFGVGADHSRFYLAHGHAHNVVIEFFLTLGVVGLVALATLLLAVGGIAAVSLVAAFARRRSPYPDRLRLIAYPLVLATYVVANQSSDSFGSSTLPLLWIVVAMALAQLELADRGHRRRAAPPPFAASGASP